MRYRPISLILIVLFAGCSRDFTNPFDPAVLPRDWVPKALKITILSAASIRLDWKHAGNYQISTIIDRRRNDQPEYHEMARIFGTSFTDSTLTEGGSYTYRVRAAVEDRTSDPTPGQKIRWLGQGTLMWETNYYMRKVRFSHNGRTLIAGGMDGTMRAYDGVTGNILWTTNIPGGIEDLDITADDKWIVVGASGGATEGKYNLVGLYKLSDGSQLWRHTFNRQIVTVAFSPDGETVASGSYDNQVRLHRSRNGALLWEKINSSFVNKVDISPDKNWVVTGSWDYYLRVRNYSDGSLIWESLNGREVWDVKTFPDNSRIAAGDLTGAVKVWHAITGGLLWSAANAGFFSLDVNPDGSSVLSTHSNDLNCYQAETGQLRWTYPKGGFCGFNHSGDRAALISNDGTVTVFDHVTGDSLWSGNHSGYVGAFSFSGDDLLLATSGADQMIRVWAARNTWVDCDEFGE